MSDDESLLPQQANQQPVQPLNQNANESPLVYEETPIIEPISDGPSVIKEDQRTQAVPEQSTSPQSLETPMVDSQPMKSNVTPINTVSHALSFLGIIKMIIMLFILFGVGVGASYIVVRMGWKLPTSLPLPISQQNTKPTSALVPTVGVVDQYAQWKSYKVTNGISKQVVDGITYMLPPDILAPICDGGNCSSSGTYLPGGTRLTIDARGDGQLLPDFRGKQITDQGGRSFVMTDITVAGRSAKEFTGLFTGTTSGGYSFSRMRGVMIPVSDTVSVEFNHFTPVLVNADFTADDVLFDKILKSIQITEQLTTPTVGPSPNVSATISATPKVCAGPTNLACGSGQVCKLSVVGKPELGGFCVSESSVQP